MIYNILFLFTHFSSSAKPNDLLVLKKPPAVTPHTIVPGGNIELSFSALLSECSIM